MTDWDSLSLPAKMRLAAEVLEEANERAEPYELEPHEGWNPGGLRVFADRWEKEDAERAAQEGDVKVTITGGRQAGKSFMLLALAEKLIRRGQNVAYVAQTMSMAQHHFYQMEHDLIGDHAFSFRRKNGEQRIMHGSGGTLFFSSGRSDNLRGVIIDTQILDDGAEYSHPTAQYVYRAVFGD